MKMVHATYFEREGHFDNEWKRSTSENPFFVQRVFNLLQFDDLKTRKKLSYYFQKFIHFKKYVFSGLYCMFRTVLR